MKAKLMTVLKVIPSLLIIAIIVSCSQDMENSDRVSTSDQTRKVHLNVTKTDFDNQGTTRSGGSGSGWEDGETIFLKFEFPSWAGGDVAGTAIYNSSTHEWDVKLDHNLLQSGTCKVEAYYFDQLSSASTTNISIAATTGVFCDADGICHQDSFGDMDIVIALKPITSRVRFKGTPNTTLMINDGITTYSAYSANTFSLTKSTTPILIEVDKDGYTPYIYGLFTNEASPRIKVTTDGTIYMRNCSTTVFRMGESGWIDLPNPTVPNGWTKADYLGLCPNADHPHQIDMGVGVKFACCNVGGTTPTGYGKYYAWGETTTKNEYNKSTYKWINSDGNYSKYVTSYSKLELSDDAAHANWGGSWRIPTKDELERLKNSCVWYMTTINGVGGYLVAASNGNAIFFPFGGVYIDSTIYGPIGTEGAFWLSNLDFLIESARILWISTTPEKAFGNVSIYIASSDRYCGRNVRAVVD